MIERNIAALDSGRGVALMISANSSDEIPPSRTMPGGGVTTPETRAFGPYYTARDGYFHIPPHPFYMFQTHTIFDGNPVPMGIIIHPTEGSFGVIFYPHLRPYLARWRGPASQALRTAFGMIDALPPAAQAIAWKHVRVDVPLDWQDERPGRVRNPRRSSPPSSPASR